MIKVTVIALGKLKESFIREAFEEYRKRLSRYCDFTLFELEDVRVSEKPSIAEINAVLDKEADIIFAKVPSNSYVISLCVEGKSLSSEHFAQKISALQSEGRGIVFIIGSSYGLSDKVKKKSDFRLSLSDMTFPHQLFRVMLSEQIYRAFKINEGGRYHK